jgi:hypothetical protein
MKPIINAPSESIVLKPVGLMFNINPAARMAMPPIEVILPMVLFLLMSFSLIDDFHWLVFIPYNPEVIALRRFSNN